MWGSRTRPSAQLRRPLHLGAQPLLRVEGLRLQQRLHHRPDVEVAPLEEPAQFLEHALFRPEVDEVLEELAGQPAGRRRLLEDDVYELAAGEVAGLAQKRLGPVAGL